jgi:hypothetical protein
VIRARDSAKTAGLDDEIDDGFEEFRMVQHGANVHRAQDTSTVRSLPAGAVGAGDPTSGNADLELEGSACGFPWLRRKRHKRRTINSGAH